MADDDHRSQDSADMKFGGCAGYGKSSIHGNGLFATHDVEADTPIWTAKAVFAMAGDVSDLVAILDHPEYKARFKPYKGETDITFHPTIQTKLNELALQHSDTDVEALYRTILSLNIRGRFFPHMAFLNHSCTPNAYLFAFHNVAELVALRDIQHGEELTISYIAAPCSTSATQVSEHVYSHFGFKCKCAAHTTCH